MKHRLSRRSHYVFPSIGIVAVVVFLLFTQTLLCYFCRIPHLPFLAVLPEALTVFGVVPLLLRSNLVRVPLLPVP